MKCPECGAENTEEMARCVCGYDFEKPSLVKRHIAVEHITTFDVFTHSQKKDVTVKDGFSWPAFFFGPWWAFSKGLPGIGIGLVVAGLVLRLISAAIGPITLLISLLVMYVVGSTGNEWRRSKILKKGYVHKATLNARNSAAALSEYYKLLNSGAEIPISSNTVTYEKQSSNEKQTSKQITITCPNCDNSELIPVEERFKVSAFSMFNAKDSWGFVKLAIRRLTCKKCSHKFVFDPYKIDIQ